MDKTLLQGDHNEDEEDKLPATAQGKNYLTAKGHERLKTELLHLIDVERPQVVEIVSWAAGNGDRSENGDYLYGKKRLREIDRRIRFLSKRLEIAEVVDPSSHHGRNQVFFGATVECEDQLAVRFTVTILGIDEADATQGQITWVSPLAKALLKSQVGDCVRLQTPSGVREIEVISVSYLEPTL